MDSKTKGMVMAGMMAGALLLAILSVFGGSWLSVDDTGDADVSYTLGGMEMSEDGVSMEIDYAEVCDETDDDDMCSAATAGTVGTLGLWLAILCAALALAMMVLPMAGIDALDALPDIASKILPWAAGGLMILTSLLWLILMPEFGDDMSTGMTFFMAIIAGVLGLAAPAMDMFVAADE